ncbi:MAG: RidA family protein [Crocinitomicaceae bacterium]
MKKVIQISGAPAPIGPYSQAVLINDTLYVSGQIPMDPMTGELAEGNIQDLTKRVMTNIGNLLNEADMDFSNIVKCSIFLKDMGQFNDVNEVYATYFNDLPPARETVQVSKLPKDVDVEISCIAVK